ncbi:putative ripening-related protein 1 [Tanacetum coccineum]
MKSFGLLFLLALLAASSFEIKAQTCKPSGGITGKKPPAGQCNRENDSDCCVQGKVVMVVVHQRVTNTTTRMTHQLSHFQVSTGWYKGGDRCHKYITINGNGRSVKEMVVDECDSTMGYDDEHDYQPPCPNNIVDASKAVWKPLGVSENN